MIFGTGQFQIIYSLADTEVTPDYTDALFECENHGFYDGQMVQIKAATTLPAGFAADSVYYINVIDKDTIELSETFKGDPVVFTDDGTGVIELYYTEETITLSHAIPVQEIDHNVKKQISPLTGKVHFTNKGRHFNFKLRYHLFKHTDPLITYNNLVKFLYQQVEVKQHSDQETFKDQHQATVLFNFSEIEEKYLEELDQRDVLYLYFESTGYIDKSKAAASVVAADEIIMSEGIGV